MVEVKPGSINKPTVTTQVVKIFFILMYATMVKPKVFNQVSNHLAPVRSTTLKALCRAVIVLVNRVFRREYGGFRDFVPCSASQSPPQSGARCFFEGLLLPVSECGFHPAPALRFPAGSRSHF